MTSSMPCTRSGSAVTSPGGGEVSDYNPRFPGKSKAYVDAYLAEESRQKSGHNDDAARGRADAAPVRADAEDRTDAELYAAHEARMRKIYTDSFREGSSGLSEGGAHEAAPIGLMTADSFEKGAA